MRISSIQLEGFKSFRAQTNLTFPKPITAIVGPNGSGKSNIADAFRWVLGEQSLKAVRSEESSDVIFGGSAKQHKLSRAAATITFQMDPREEVPDGASSRHRELLPDASEVEISRKIYRTGESSYELQKREARLLDIQLFLAERNVGQRNYAVVGQGMIDEVLKLSPRDRMDFFYEATGVKKYQIKLHKAGLRIASSRERLSQTAILIKELAPRKSYLEKQAEKYVKRAEILEQLSKKHALYYSHTIREIEFALLEKRRDFQQLEKELEKAAGEVSNLERDMDSAHSDSEISTRDSRLMEEIERLRRDDGRASGRISELKYLLEHRLEDEGKFDAAFLRRRKREVEEFLDAIFSDRSSLEEAIKICKTREREQKEELKKISEEIGEAISSHTFSKERVVLQLEEIAALSDSLLVHARLREFIAELRSDEENNFSGDHEARHAEIKSDLQELALELAIHEERSRIIGTEEAKYRGELNDLSLKLKKGEDGITKELSAEILERISKEEKARAEIEKKTRSLEDDRKLILLEMEKTRERLFEWQKRYKKAEDLRAHINGLLQAVKIDIARLEAKREETNSEMMELFGAERAAEIISNEQASVGAAPGNVRYGDLRILKSEIRKLEADAGVIGEVEPDVLKEYEEVRDRFAFLTSQSEDLSSAITSLEKVSRELERVIKTRFDETFHNLNRAFGAYVRELFSGGSGSLEVSAVANEAGEGEEASVHGISIMAQPPGKKIKHMNALSGGERSLVCVALIFAVISSNPPPFVILDEIDAALDEANSKRLADIIKKLSARTQFIMITHNRTTMEVADVLYGVTMDDEGVSRLVGVSLEGYE
ncbi:MAG: AAA family ATPase [Candidatus Jacksonbacteria bacterium]|nr:AAA family ATPase [Candidatus Jacksonbacteria bacterium]